MLTHLSIFLHSAKQQYWQILPLGPTGYGNSPYMCYSALAGNPFLISPTKLMESGFLIADEVENLPEFSNDKVDFNRAIEVKEKLFQIAYHRFQETSDLEHHTDFDRFCQSQVHWLDDYTLFMAVREAHDDKSWTEWEPELVNREPIALIHWQNHL